MEKLYKRLKAIEYAIELDDADVLLLHLSHIEAYRQQIPDIFLALESCNYQVALKLIDIFLNQHNNVVQYDDPEIKALQSKYKELQNVHVEYLAKREDALKLISMFSDAYYQHLGQLLGQIVAIQKRILEKELHELNKEHSSKELNDEKERKKKAYEDIKQQEEELKSEYQKTQEHNKKNTFIINEKIAKILKELYYKAAKLCHPDGLPEHLREKATKIFHRVSNAYQEGDVEQLEELIEMLEGGEFDVQDYIPKNKEILLKKIQKLEELIKNLKEELQEIYHSHEYKLAIHQELWYSYFEQQRYILQGELERLRQKEREINERMT